MSKGIEEFNKLDKFTELCSSCTIGIRKKGWELVAVSSGTRFIFKRIDYT